MAAALIPPESEKISIHNTKKKTKDQNRSIIFFDGVKKYKKDIKIRIDIAQEIDIVEYDDLQ